MIHFFNKTTFLIICTASLTACTAEMNDVWNNEKKIITEYDYSETIEKINPIYTRSRYIKHVETKAVKKACVHNASESRVVTVEGLSDEINYQHCMGRTFDGAPDSQRLEGR
jgi:hypothetical protein